MAEYTMQYLKQNGEWKKRGPFESVEDVIAAIVNEPATSWDVLEHVNGVGQFPIRSFYEHLGWYGDPDELKARTLSYPGGRVMDRQKQFDHWDDVRTRQTMHRFLGPSQGFWLHTEYGTAHVLGDPNMSQETIDALQELIRCARRAIEDGTLKGDDDEA